MPSTVASFAASRRIAARLRSPSLRRLRVLSVGAEEAEALIRLDKLARTVV